MSDPRRLLATYDRLAEEANAAGKNQLPLWSGKLLDKIGAASTAQLSSTRSAILRP